MATINQTDTLKPSLNSFQTLVELVHQLRGPDGCPWDKEQTAESLCAYVMEEAYELVQAIHEGHDLDVCDELGDYLFQVMIQAQILEEKGKFTIKDIVDALNEKLIRRHPHVFGKKAADGSKITTAEVLVNWDETKREEKKMKIEARVAYDLKQNENRLSESELRTKYAEFYARKNHFKNVFNHPSLESSALVGKNTAKYKFDWTTVDQVFEKLEEEMAELKVELQQLKSSSDSPDVTMKKIEEELGDVLFACAQLARHLKLSPEETLKKANQKFIKRFDLMVELSGLSLEGFIAIPESEKESLWLQAKKQLKS